MTLQEAPVHTNKIRLHCIELKQTLEELIYGWDAACKMVLPDPAAVPCCNVRGTGGSESRHNHNPQGGCLLAGSCGSWRRRGIRNGSLPKNQWGLAAVN